MQDFGGGEIFTPSESAGSASEGVSEEARQRFQAQAAAAAQVRKEEQKSKRRDDGVAGAILQFLTDAQRKHLANMIARLVGRDCPSPFLLAVLSLISADCRTRVDEYLQDEDPQGASTDTDILPADMADRDAAQQAAAWTRRMERVLKKDTANILRSLMSAEGQLDGSLLQLAAAVVQQFANERGTPLAIPAAQQAAAQALQRVFGPHMPSGALGTNDQ